MARVVKFEYGTDIRRAKVAELTHESLQCTLKEVYGERAASDLTVKYADDDGDLCTLTPETFFDFASLNADRAVVRVHLVGQGVAVGAPAAASKRGRAAGEAEGAAAGEPEAEADVDMGGGPDGPQMWNHGPWHHQFAGAWPPNPLHGIAMGLSMCSDSHLAAKLVHFAPALCAHLEGREADIDRAVADKKDLLVPLLQSLREGLEPFPQFQEAQMALDRLVRAEQLDGLGAAATLLLRSLIALPEEQQREVAAVIFSGFSEKLAQAVPALFGASAKGGWAGWPAATHAHITCDGCDESPLTGPRFKCTVCPDYDLCASCYMRKDELHPGGHAFQHIPAVGWGHGGCRRWGPCGWQVKWAKGKGMGKGKGNGKGKRCWAWACPSSSSSASSKTSSSTSDQECAEPGIAPTHGKCQWKKIRKEAKMRMKVQIKAAKKTFKQEKKAWKAQRLAEKQARKQVVADKKAAWWAARRAEAEAKGGLVAFEAGADKKAAWAAKQAEVENARVADDGKSPLQTLAEMGFEDIELLASLLEAHDNNVSKVLEVLLSDVPMAS